jgi:hypothetical protein
MTLPDLILLRRLDAAKASSLIHRDAFLYMEPVGDQFAQCGTCRAFHKKESQCATVDAKHFDADMSCGLYVNGTPGTIDPPATGKKVPSKEAGLVDRQVRCENCVSYIPGKGGRGDCRLYGKLTKAHSDMFDLDKDVSAHGCCNAQMPK